jgi:predicted Ser/Thr protein kinase
LARASTEQEQQQRMADRPRASTSTELDPLIGLTVSGRYRVHALIGQGGMGKVFRAQQIPLGRSVALKVLEASHTDPEFQRRFFQEAAILAKLQSRHTVTIFDYGRDGDLYFIAMELISGASLDRVLAGTGPMPASRALSIAQQVCRSLREAHAQGVIHRDLKPGNVVLTQTEDGEELAKVLDFGLAKRMDRVSTENTQADTVPGSPKYMAPEVIRQQPIDGRVDMYGLGVMLYQMLTGVVPFDRENPMDILVAHLQEQPRPLRQANPDVDIPDALERLVLRCLAKAPEERFSDMQELLEAMRALALELGLGSESSLAGATLVPDSAPSGLRPAIGEPLRLDAHDIGAPVLPAREHGPARSTVIALSVVALAVVLAVIALVARPAPPEPVVTSAPPTAVRGAPAVAAPAPKAVPSASVPAALPKPAVAIAVPSKPTSAAPPSSTATDTARAAQQPPDMVIAPSEVADTPLPSVRLRVQSEPSGAAVLVQGQRMGTTPVSFVWHDRQAHLGGQLAVELRLPGYAPYMTLRTVDGEELELSATLAPSNDEPSVAPAAAVHAPAPAPAPSAPASPTAQPGEPSPVLKVTPSEPKLAPQP